MDTTHNVDGSEKHILKSVKKIELKYFDNDSVKSFDGLNYSPNGRWAVAMAGTDTMVRLDLKTGKILNFGDPRLLGSSRNFYKQLSITNDGKYVAAVNTDGTIPQKLFVYDLASCKSGEHSNDGYITKDYAGCEYRDITGYLKTSISGFNRFTMAEFANPDSLVFYHYTKDEAYTKYLMYAPNTSGQPKSYIALGDSYASGEGAGNYLASTDAGQNQNACHLSKNSYPYVMGQIMELNQNDVRSVACSGAKIRNVIGPGPLDNDLSNPNRGNQFLSEVPGNELGDWLPGFQLQKTFIEQNQPDVITVSMMSEDVGLLNKITRCLGEDTCYNNLESRKEIVQETNRKFGSLVGMYQEIQIASGPGAKIYVTGYPDIVKPDGICQANVRLDSAERQFASLLTKQINLVISRAAAKAGVKYIDTESALYGHRLCEDPAAGLAVNGFVVSNEPRSVIGAESFHPNRLGHQLLAQKILAETSNFSAIMPHPDASATLGADEVADPAFLDVTAGGDAEDQINYEGGLVEDVIYKNEELGIEYSALKSISTLNKPVFEPNSEVEIVLHSDPTVMGSATADEFGNLDQIKLRVPGTVPTGFHTLHLFGIGLDGEPIDIYKVVYVGATPNDENGNGIDDILEPCGVFTALGVDSDNDGIDDACDPQIDVFTLMFGPAMDEGKGLSSPEVEESVAPKTSSSWISRIRQKSAVNLPEFARAIGNSYSNVGGTSGGGDGILAAKSQNGFATATSPEAIRREEQINRALIASVIVVSVGGMTFTLKYHLRYGKH